MQLECDFTHAIEPSNLHIKDLCALEIGIRVGWVGRGGGLQFTFCYKAIVYILLSISNEYLLNMSKIPFYVSFSADCREHSNTYRLFNKEIDNKGKWIHSYCEHSLDKCNSCFYK